MYDPRYSRLAETIVHHSCTVQKGEKVLVETFDIPSEFTVVLIRAIADAGGIPLCLTKENRVLTTCPWPVREKPQLRPLIRSSGGTTRLLTSVRRSRRSGGKASSTLKTESHPGSL